MATRTPQWTLTGILSSLILPAAMAMIPGIRRRYGMGLFSVPSLILMGGIWMMQRYMDRRSPSINRHRRPSPSGP